MMQAATTRVKWSNSDSLTDRRRCWGRPLPAALLALPCLPGSCCRGLLLCRCRCVADLAALQGAGRAVSLE
jgi:hypothetical protein